MGGPTGLDAETAVAPVWTAVDPRDVVGVVITAVGPVWMAVDPRDVVGVVITAFGPRWTFTPPVAVTEVRRQFP